MWGFENPVLHVFLGSMKVLQIIFGNLIKRQSFSLYLLTVHLDNVNNLVSLSHLVRLKSVITFNRNINNKFISFWLNIYVESLNVFQLYQSLQLFPIKVVQLFISQHQWPNLHFPVVVDFLDKSAILKSLSLGNFSHNVFILSKVEIIKDSFH